MRSDQTHRRYEAAQRSRAYACLADENHGPRALQETLLAGCPTYRRLKLVANTIACFERQTYPADRRRRIVLDDAGEIEPCTSTGSVPNWEIIVESGRYPTLPAKYNRVVELALPSDPEYWPDILAVWEDDDIYLP